MKLLLLLLLVVGLATACRVRRGSRGSCVRRVQAIVGATADGIFGPNTERAVKAYQRVHKLTADGIVGAKTWAVMSSNNCGCSSQGATGCSNGPTQGARNLASYLKSKFGGRTEIYNCRKIANSNSYSLHAEGRAVDLYVGISTGQSVMRHLKSIACSHGIQEVIHNRRIWSSRGERAYNGKSPHTDHVHIGLNHCGARSFNLS